MNYKELATFYRDTLGVYIAPVEVPIVKSDGTVDSMKKGKPKYYKAMPTGYRGRFHGKNDYLRPVSDKEIQEWEYHGFGLATIPKESYQHIIDIDCFGPLTREEFWKKYGQEFSESFVTASARGLHIFIHSDKELPYKFYLKKEGVEVTGEIRSLAHMGHTVEPPSPAVNEKEWILAGRYMVVNQGTWGKIPEGWEVGEREKAITKSAPIKLPRDVSDNISRARAVSMTHFVTFRECKALCPFHSEKTPSFHYYPPQNKAFCFGCNRPFDVIDIVKHKYGFSFLEALKFLESYNHKGI